jgi:hypothetical protein
MVPASTLDTHPQDFVYQGGVFEQIGCNPVENHRFFDHRHRRSGVLDHFSPGCELPGLIFR